MEEYEVDVENNLLMNEAWTLRLALPSLWILESQTTSYSQNPLLDPPDRKNSAFFYADRAPGFKERVELVDQGELPYALMIGKNNQAYHFDHWRHLKSCDVFSPVLRKLFVDKR